MDLPVNYFNFYPNEFKDEIKTIYPWLNPYEKLYLESGRYISQLLFENLYNNRNDTKLLRSIRSIQNIMKNIIKNDNLLSITYSIELYTCRQELVDNKDYFGTKFICMSYITSDNSNLSKEDLNKEYSIQYFKNKNQNSIYHQLAILNYKKFEKNEAFNSFIEASVKKIISSFGKELYGYIANQIDYMYY